FVVTLLVIAFRFPSPTAFQYNVFRIVLSLAAAGTAAMIQGFTDLQLSATTNLFIRAGGALAVFLIVFFFNPARLAAHNRDSDEAELATPPGFPERLRDGMPFPANQRAAFLHVWESLVQLNKVGKSLWEHCSDATLSSFADQLHETQQSVERHALFFSESDYSALLEILRTANFYLTGKNRLLDIRSGVFYREKDGYIDLVRLAAPGEENKVVDDNVKQQVQQNKRWLTHYRKILADLRLSLHRVMVEE